MPHFDADQWSVLLITVIFGAALDRRRVCRSSANVSVGSMGGHDGVAVECPFYPEVTDIGGRRRARQRQATGRARRADDPGRMPGWASLHPAISSMRFRASGGRAFVSDTLPQRPDHILHDKRILPAVR